MTNSNDVQAKTKIHKPSICFFVFFAITFFCHVMAIVYMPLAPNKEFDAFDIYSTVGAVSLFCAFISFCIGKTFTDGKATCFFWITFVINQITSIIGISFGVGNVIFSLLFALFGIFAAFIILASSILFPVFAYFAFCDNENIHYKKLLLCKRICIFSWCVYLVLSIIGSPYASIPYLIAAFVLFISKENKEKLTPSFNFDPEEEAAHRLFFDK